jgi:predicted acylesterase/phospholipase RssA
MKELYELTSIELYFYTVDVNKFILKELSHINTPDLSVLEAIYMSSTIPVIMSPLVNNNECYIDGGFLCNYPIQQCLKNVEKNEVLGIDYKYNMFKKTTFVNENTNVIDYIYTILNNIIILISNMSNHKEITKHYEISIIIEWSFNSFINIFFSNEERIKWYDLGIKSANKFITSL